MYKGWKLLTKKERKHLSTYHILYTYELENLFKAQKVMRDEPKSKENHYEPCFDCYFIAKKLGYPV